MNLKKTQCEAMKFIVKHCDAGYQVFEKDGAEELLIATFHKGLKTRTGEKSQTQIRAEEYCEFLNQKDIGDNFTLEE